MRRIISLVFLLAACSPKETTESTSIDSTAVTTDSSGLQPDSSAAATPPPHESKLDQFNVDITFPFNDESFVLVTDGKVAVYSKPNHSDDGDKIDEVDGPFTAKMLTSESAEENCGLPYYKIEYVDNHGATKKGWVGGYSTEVYSVLRTSLHDATYNIPGFGAVKLGVMEGLPLTYSAGDGVDCTMTSTLVFFYDDKQLHLVDPHFTQEVFEGDEVPANGMYGYLHLETGFDVEQVGQITNLVLTQDPKTWITVEWKDNRLTSGDVMDTKRKTYEGSWKFLGFSDDFSMAAFSGTRLSPRDTAANSTQAPMQVITVRRLTDGELVDPSIVIAPGEDPLPVVRKYVNPSNKGEQIIIAKDAPDPYNVTIDDKTFMIAGGVWRNKWADPNQIAISIQYNGKNARIYKGQLGNDVLMRNSRLVAVYRNGYKWVLIYGYETWPNGGDLSAIPDSHEYLMIVADVNDFVKAAM